MPDTTQLSKNYTVAKYRKLEAAQRPKKEIAKFFVERFTERYITPINAAGRKHKHGFCTMAVSCLMIEALESFWCGWPDTKHRSALAFCQFFQRTPAFSAFLGFVPQFYENVRCGILHQAETTGGWHIQREGDLFETKSLTINATKFHRVVKGSLSAHAKLLISSAWDSERWRNFRKKMEQVCKNCS
jgi:hypothetical protein